MATTKRQLADWVEAALALPNVIESPFRHLGHYRGGRGTAIDSGFLGLALVGKVGNAEEALELYNRREDRSDGPWEYLLSLLGITSKLAKELQQCHYDHPANEMVQKIREGEL